MNNLADNSMQITARDVVFKDQLISNKHIIMFIQGGWHFSQLVDIRLCLRPFSSLIDGSLLKIESLQRNCYRSIYEIANLGTKIIIEN